MQQWEYEVASVDYRGRISVEGQETLIGNERRTAFLRRFLDTVRDMERASTVQSMGYTQTIAACGVRS